MLGFHRFLVLASLLCAALAAPGHERKSIEITADIGSLTIDTPITTTRSKEQTTPAKGSLVVDGSGKYPGSYANISAAVTALHNETSPQSIFIFPGIYKEQVYIGPLTSALTIQGYTRDRRSFHNNEVTLTYNLSRNTPNLTNNDATSTLRLWSSNVKIYNLNIANTFGYSAKNGQALALSAQNTDQGFYGCNFTGYQDTIYANQGRQIYARSFVNGAVDFIFGLRARAWFHKLDIETIGPGYISANGRDAANNTSLYVFNEVRVTGSSGPNSTVLGRPWRPYSRTVFQKSYLGDVVRAEGWQVWDDVQSVDNVWYREYKNFGPGAVGPRANWTAELSKRVKEGEVLGEGWKEEEWVDEEYLT